MAAKLTEAKIQQAFQLYAGCRSVAKVAEVSRLSETTVRKYCRERNWPERVQQIQSDVEKSLDICLTAVFKESWRLVQECKRIIGEKIDAGKIKSSSTASDLCTIIKLERLLTGDSTERVEVLKRERRARLEKLSTQELVALLKELEK